MAAARALGSVLPPLLVNRVQGSEFRGRRIQRHGREEPGGGRRCFEELGRILDTEAVELGPHIR